MTTDYERAGGMPISRRTFGLGAGAGVFAASASWLTSNAAYATPTPNPDWIGDLDTIISPDNPYLAIAELNVDRALASSKPYGQNETFWKVWAATAPESSRRDDSGVQDLAVAAAEQFIPSVNNIFWTVHTGLEVVRMLRPSGLVDDTTITSWLGSLSVHVQGNYDANADATAWTYFAPNTLHQSAVILELGSQLIGSHPEWSAMGVDLLERAATMQEDDGAFHYIRESGPSPAYYGFDATWLGCYYQLTQSDLARAGLVKMAKYAHDVLANGMIEAASAPWWKHVWGISGPFHGPEIAAGVGQDSLSRSVAEYRLPLKQSYYYTYYPMYFWDGQLSSTVELGADLTRFNTNFNGPQLRRGAWQVVMPGKAYADTSVGVSMASGQKKFKFDGYLDVAALPILTDPDANPYRNGGSGHDGGLLVLAPEEMNNRVSLVDDEMVAVGATFQPRFPYGDGNVVQGPKGWVLDQAWVATGEFLAGWMQVHPTADVTSDGGPRGMVRVGDDVTVTDAAQHIFSSGDLMFQAHGAFDDMSIVSGPPPGQPNQLVPWIWLDLTGAGARSYTQGERLGYGLSVVPTTAGAPAPTLELLPRDDGLLSFEVRPANGENLTVLYNPGVRAVRVSSDALKGAVEVIRPNRHAKRLSHRPAERVRRRGIVVRPRELVVGRALS